jgi:hypothetical protein
MFPPEKLPNVVAAVAVTFARITPRCWTESPLSGSGFGGWFKHRGRNVGFLE